MGHSNRQKHWLRHKRQNEPQTMPAEVWRVAGVDKNGESIDFNVLRCGDAYEDAERINNRGGRVRVQRMVWDGPAAAYRLPRESDKQVQ